MDSNKAAEIKSQAHKLAQSCPGYSYNQTTLDAIVDAGQIPDGATIMLVGQQVAKLEGAEVVTYNPDGSVARRTPASADRAKELMAYAITASRTAR